MKYKKYEDLRNKNAGKAEKETEKMIYTVTFNPSLDYIVTVPHFTLRNGQPDIRGEEFFRVEKESMYPWCLKNLGLENTALGFMPDLPETNWSV